MSDLRTYFASVEQMAATHIAKDSIGREWGNAYYNSGVEAGIEGTRMALSYGYGGRCFTYSVRDKNVSRF